MRSFIFLLLLNSISNATYSQESCSKLSENWALAINRSDSGTAYLLDGIAITSEGQLINNRTRLKEYVGRLNETLADIRIEKVQACVRASSEITYDITTFFNNAHKRYGVMSIWNGQLKEFEMIAAVSETNFSISELDDRRQDWIDLCNQHNASSLVSELYEPEAIYYNHRPVDIGITQIAERYAYMNRDSYSLTLTPIKVFPVNDHIVFEVGQCSGSYGGKYMLIWRKNNDGIWKILFDSNI